MKLRHIYLILCAFGIVLPYSQFVPWLATEGLDLPLFLRELFSNRIGAFFGMDVVVSAIVLPVFALVEGRRLEIGHLWAPVIATPAGGVSLGLPLFLYLRERQREARA